MPPTSGYSIDHKLLIKRGKDSKSFLKCEDKDEIYAQSRVGLVTDKSVIIRAKQRSLSDSYMMIFKTDPQNQLALSK